MCNFCILFIVLQTSGYWSLRHKLELNFRLETENVRDKPKKARRLWKTEEETSGTDVKWKKKKTEKKRELQMHDEHEAQKDERAFSVCPLAAACTVCAYVRECTPASVCTLVLETKNSMFTQTVCQTSLVNTADTVAA